MEKRFKLYAAKEFFKVLFDCVLLTIGTRLRPLLRTDFPRRIAATASWLSLGGSRLLGGPTGLVNFCALMWGLRVEQLNFVTNRLY